MYLIRKQILLSLRITTPVISARKKIKNKLQLQKDLGLEVDPKVMMIGIVSVSQTRRL